MSELLGIARFKFHEGKLEEYKRHLLKVFARRAIEAAAAGAGK